MTNSDPGKVKMGTAQLLNPRPAVLIGTVLDGKPNFITVSWCGVTSANPPTMYIAIRNIRYSLAGIKSNKTFSVNVPSSSMVKETDYCGCVSGKEHDKVEECKFNLFCGELEHAPMISQCPVNIECKVIREIELGDHTLFIGEIIESYISEDCMTDSDPDIQKIDPLSFCSFTTHAMGYYKLGKFLSGTASVTKK